MLLSGRISGVSVDVRPRKAHRTTTPSSSAPACRASTSSTACASWACGCGCSRPAPASAAPGTGTAIPARASIRRAIPTATPSRQELLDEWNWTEHFAPQPETLRYLNYVADKFDLRRDIQFQQPRDRGALAGGDAQLGGDAGGRQPPPRALPDHRDRPAVGADHAARSRASRPSRASPTTPRAGRKEPVSFEGKRVAVIGTGATGVQTIQEVAKTAGHLTVFQRTPNWCAPLHNGQIAEEEMARDQGRLSRDVPALPGDLRLLPAHARPARHLRGDAGGARGLLGEALRRARLRHLAGQFPRHTDRPRRRTR